MNIDEIKSVCAEYKTSFNKKGYLIPKKDPGDEGPTHDGRYSHLLWMCEEIIEGRVEGEKVHRWLGFIQGVLYDDCQKTINQLKVAD